MLSATNLALCVTSCRIAASNIVFNYILANAAVARSFSGYFASLCDQVSAVRAVLAPCRLSVGLGHWTL